MIRDYGVNQFKFDGTGNAESSLRRKRFRQRLRCCDPSDRELRAQKPRSLHQPHHRHLPVAFLAALCRLDLARRRRPRLRWASARIASAGSPIATPTPTSTSCMDGPLYPLNSLMLHGLIFAKHAGTWIPIRATISRTKCAITSAPARSCRRCTSRRRCSPRTIGTISPRRRSGRVRMRTFWWTRTGSAAIRRELEVYGWASWSPRKGILVLRNPSDQPQSIAIDLAKAFELPLKSAKEFRLRSPWKEDRPTPIITVRAGEPHEFQLKPFEVKVLEAAPVEQLMRILRFRVGTFFVCALAMPLLLRPRPMRKPRPNIPSASTAGTSFSTASRSKSSPAKCTMNAFRPNIGTTA